VKKVENAEKSGEHKSKSGERRNNTLVKSPILKAT